MSYSTVPSVPMNSKIITLAIVTHGNISQFNIPEEKQRIFDNVRLFSKAGKFQEAVTTRFIEYTNILPPLNERFRENNITSTLHILKTYADDLNEKYNNLLDSTYEQEMDRTQVCKIYYPITFDKQFTVVPPTRLETIMSCITPIIQGIYVVSVHEYSENANKLHYVFPEAKNSKINLLDSVNFVEFVRALGVTVPVGTTIFTYLTRTYDPNSNNFIFMSELVKVIKGFVTDPLCYINIIDHSCSVTNTKHVTPEEVQSFEKYAVPVDIEMGMPNWGGQKTNKTKKKTKKIKKTKKKSKRYRRKKKNTKKR